MRANVTRAQEGMLRHPSKGCTPRTL